MAQEISLTSAMRANLLSLQSTVSMLNRTQERLSSGKKVNSALDSPTNYFAAKGHQNRANDIASRKDSMGEAIQTVKSASSGIDSINTLIESARGIAQAALSSSDTTQRAQYVTQYNAVVSQINTLASDSGYRGTNLLIGNTLSVKFNEDGASSLSIEGFNATATGLTIGGRRILGRYHGWHAGDQLRSDTAVGCRKHPSCEGIVTVVKPEHRADACGLGRSDDRHVARRCECSDRSRHERGRCEYAHVADPAVAGHDGTEPVRPERTVGPAAVLEPMSDPSGGGRGVLPPWGFSRS